MVTPEDEAARTNSLQARFLSQSRQLAELAFQATQQGHRPSEFILLSASPFDPNWADLVQDYIEPEEWEGLEMLRDAGKKPVVNLTLESGILASITLIAPGVIPILERPMPAGFVRTIVLGENGDIGIYSIQPKHHGAN
jgi:hypothetical protein